MGFNKVVKPHEWTTLTGCIILYFKPVAISIINMLLKENQMLAFIKGLLKLGMFQKNKQRKPV